MYRFALTLAVIFHLANFAQAQVVFKGPTEAKPNRMTTITLEKVDGDDLKLQGFVNGKPSDAGDWLMMKNLDNQVVIFLMTDKEGVYTFLAATNKTGKTYLSNHVITISSGSTPTPIVPTPPTPTNSLGDKLKTSYRVSPDATSLTKLIAILEQVNAQNFKNYDEMEQVLSATGKKFLPNGELQKLRDLISQEIVDKCGVKNSEKDLTKVKSILSDAISALKNI